MANTLETKLGLDINNWLANAKAAGDVTEREFTRMQRAIKVLNTHVVDLSRYGKEAANSAPALEHTAKSMEHVGFASAGAKRELVVLAHELSQGNYSKFGGSIMVLAERTNAAELAFSALGVAALATAATVGGFVVAVVAGHLEQEKFAKSLILTGNAAGMTADSFAALANSSASMTDSTIGKSREALQELVSTGRLYPEVIGIATQASLNLQRVSGQSGEEIAKDFAKMGDGVAKWAADYNKHAHFVSEAQFVRIKALDDAGKKEEAARLVLTALNDELKDQTTKLGYAERAWRGLKTGVGSFIDGLKDIGRGADDAERLLHLQEQLIALDTTNLMHPVGGQQLADRTAVRASLAAQIDAMRERMKFASQAALTQAAEAEKADKAIAKLMEPPKSTLDPKAYQRFLSDAQAYNNETETMARYGAKVTEWDKRAATEKAKLRNETEKLTASQQAALGALIETQRQQRMQAADEEEVRAYKLQHIIDLTAEQARQNGMVTSFVSAGHAMVQSLNDQRAEIGLTADELVRLTQMRQLDNAEQAAMQGASADTVVAIQQQAEVLRNNLGAALDKLQKKRDAYNADFANGQAKAWKTYSDEAANQAKFAESYVGGSLKQMEDSILSFVKTGKLSFSNLFAFMADEFIRNQVRMALAGNAGGLLGNLFGSAGGISGLIKGAAALMGMGGSAGAVAGTTGDFARMDRIPGFANGLDYVPYNGFTATLHEGEKVLTRQDAMRGRGADAPTVHITYGDIHVGQGVSRGEVASALKISHAQTIAAIERLHRTTGRFA